MKIALIGYGKMGKAIEALAEANGDSIVCKIAHSDDLPEMKHHHPNVAIEFTNPESAFDNILFCIKNDIPVVSGTTGWLDKFEEIKGLCLENKGAFFYASNFSLGVNLFFHFNQYIAKVMSKYSDYDVEIEETHHIYKRDAPSGTAISLAEKIINAYPEIGNWSLDEKEKDKINIIAHRKEDVPGTHVVRYSSNIDEMEFTHIAKGRTGFAQGALAAAKWLIRKKGVFGMPDMMNLE
ncbi:4-hydroxy-tetrahydrodipicolinate reductase [Hyphobacterium sp. CCMP332]|nr:4-hydroxy-tetrahydrodipicolinate reductase [Hyphobacterium sp. CCMP332]